MDDILGQTYAIYIIVVAGAESAIGLGILVAFYRLIIVYKRSYKKILYLINLLYQEGLHAILQSLF